MAETANIPPALLSPKLDVVFKCLFAPEPALLADLLNAILPLDGYAAVAVLQVRNPDVDRETISAKQIVLDIRAVDASGRQFNIELQVQRQPAYIQRAIFYLCRLHASQLNPGQSYEQIRPTLGIHLLDFTLEHETSAWRHCFEWRERTEPVWRLTDQQALWLIELPKAPATPSIPERSELDWWVDFFNDPEFIMSTDTDVPAPVKRAAEKLQQLSADEKARELAWDRERALIDWQIERNAARAEGKVEGKAEGEAEAKRTVARALLSEGFSIQKTAALTGLSASQVEVLAANQPPAS